MDVNEAVQKIADAFANAEERAAATRHEFRDLKDAYNVIRDAGHLGGIQTLAIIRHVDAIATAFEATILTEHADQVRIAQDAGIDLPSSRSGGGR